MAILSDYESSDDDPEAAIFRLRLSDCDIKKRIPRQPTSDCNFQAAIFRLRFSGYDLPKVIRRQTTPESHLQAAILSDLEETIFKQPPKKKRVWWLKEPNKFYSLIEVSKKRCVRCIEKLGSKMHRNSNSKMHPAVKSGLCNNFEASLCDCFGWSELAGSQVGGVNELAKSDKFYPSNSSLELHRSNNLSNELNLQNSI